MMNRRQFMKAVGKICAGIPIIGGLATTGQVGASESKLAWPIKIFNGQVFQAPYPLCHTVIVLYHGRGDEWMLMYGPYKAAQHGGTAMGICHYERKDGSYNPVYTQKELQEKLKDWKLVESKLELEDKNPELTEDMMIKELDENPRFSGSPLYGIFELEPEVHNKYKWFKLISRESIKQ